MLRHTEFDHPDYNDLREALDSIKVVTGVQGTTKLNRAV